MTSLRRVPSRAWAACPALLIAALAAGCESTGSSNDSPSLGSTSEAIIRKACEPPQVATNCVTQCCGIEDGCKILHCTTLCDCVDPPVCVANGSCSVKCVDNCGTPCAGGDCPGVPVPVSCPFDGSCAPGQYGLGTASGGTGCSFTPPSIAGCQTAPKATEVPTFTAPVITAVALGASAVYGVGTPSTPIPGGQPCSTSTHCPMNLDCSATTHTCVDDRAAVFAWGNNQSYQLGDGTGVSSTSTSPPVVAVYVQGNPVTQVAAGDTDACALMADGTVQCWGTIVTTNGPGITYTAPTKVLFPPTVTKIFRIAHGQHHACAWDNTDPVGSGIGVDSIWCWGDNNAGQLGASGYPYLDPDPNNPRPTPAVQVSFAPPSCTSTADCIAATGAASATCNAVTKTCNGAPAIQEVLGIAASGDSTCLSAAIQYPGQSLTTGVYCWGDDQENSLGDGKGVAGNPGSHEINPQIVLVNRPALGGPVPVYLPLTNVIGGSAGAAGDPGSFCAQVVSKMGAGGWYCWGGNASGQIDLRIPPMSPNDENVSMGVPSPQQLGDLVARNAATIAVSGDHGCVVTTSLGGSPAVYCFGSNDVGQLGFAASLPFPVNEGVPGVTGSGMSTPVTMPTAITATGIPVFTQVSPGYQFTCGIYTTTAASYGKPNATGNLACWGAEGALLNSAVPTFMTW